MTIKEELAKELLEILQLSKQGVMVSLEFVKVQAPELVRELILFGIVENGVIFGLWLGVFSLIMFCIYKLFKYSMSLDQGDKESGVLFTVGITTFTIFVFALLAIPPLITTLKAILAPRLYLIDYLSEVVK